MRPPQNHPAFWFRTNTTANRDGPEGCQEGDPALNELDTHPHDLGKNVTIGCFGMDNCVEFSMSADLGAGNGQPTDYHYAQLEGPTVSVSMYKDKIMASTHLLRHMGIPDHMTVVAHYVTGLLHG